jgi:serine/threonine protein kinase
MAFPNMVSKIMYTPESYRTALRVEEQLKKDVPALAGTFVPYRRKYRTTNLTDDPALQERIEEEVKPGSRIYVARMPYLGVNCDDIVKSRPLQRQLQAHGPRSLAHEVLRMMSIVKMIHQKGYVHSDIRTSNLMVNADTGQFTIIDFDFFLTVERYQRKYSHIFYSHPPEEIFLRRQGMKKSLAGKLVDTLDDRAEFERFIVTTAYASKSEYKRYASWISSYDDMVVNVTDAMMRLWGIYAAKVAAASASADLDELAELTVEEFDRMTISTVDSYGLASALYILFKGGLDARGFTFLRDALIERILPAMLHANIYKRMSVDGGIAALSTVIDLLEEDYSQSSSNGGVSPAPAPVPAEPVFMPPPVMGGLENWAAFGGARKAKRQTRRIRHKLDARRRTRVA